MLKNLLILTTIWLFAKLAQNNLVSIVMQSFKLAPKINFKVYRGSEIAEILAPLSQLRITVFREYPYLYDGNLAYEQRYLSRYVNISDSFTLLALDGDNVIGATTALPLAKDEEFRDYYENAGFNSSEIYYFGEAMLKPQYRGMGIYKTFMRERIQAAIAYGATTSTFLAVNRPENHPLRPLDYQDLKPVWRHYGFVEHPEVEALCSWKDIDQTAKTEKSLTAWMKAL